MVLTCQDVLEMYFNVFKQHFLQCLLIIGFLHCLRIVFECRIVEDKEEDDVWQLLDQNVEVPEATAFCIENFSEFFRVSSLIRLIRQDQDRDQPAQRIRNLLGIRMHGRIARVSLGKFGYYGPLS